MIQGLRRPSTPAMTRRLLHAPLLSLMTLTAMRLIPPAYAAARCGTTSATNLPLATRRGCATLSSRSAARATPPRPTARSAAAMLASLR
jgi:hypothetical protein